MTPEFAAQERERWAKSGRRPSIGQRMRMSRSGLVRWLGLKLLWAKVIVGFKLGR